MRGQRFVIADMPTSAAWTLIDVEKVGKASNVLACLSIRVPHLRRGLIATKVGHRAKHDPSSLHQSRDIRTGRFIQKIVTAWLNFTVSNLGASAYIGIGCPIFATALSSIRWAIFAAAKIPILSKP
jgi:hypothetical protein